MKPRFDFMHHKPSDEAVINKYYDKYENGKGMKAIICGGRNYTLSEEDFSLLNHLHEKHPITEVVSGDANGADLGGQVWANKNNLPVKHFPADWQTFGPSAGPIRNRKMAEYADVCIAFPGGKGTENMIEEARRHELAIITFPERGK